MAPSRPFDDGVSGADDGAVAVQRRVVLGKVQRMKQPRQGAAIGLGDGLLGKFGQFIEELFASPLDHVVDHAHVPQVHRVARDVLMAHVFRNFGFRREVPV